MICFGGGFWVRITCVLTLLLGWSANIYHSSVVARHGTLYLRDPQNVYHRSAAAHDKNLHVGGTQKFIIAVSLHIRKTLMWADRKSLP